MIKDNSIDGRISQVLHISREHEPMNAEQLGLKLCEEAGELAATINIFNGNMPHKQLEDSPFEETADVINVMCGILSKLYPELTTPQIVDQLKNAMDTKRKKYVSIIKPQ